MHAVPDAGIGIAILPANRTFTVAETAPETIIAAEAEINTEIGIEAGFSVRVLKARAERFFERAPHELVLTEGGHLFLNGRVDPDRDVREIRVAQERDLLSVQSFLNSGEGDLFKPLAISINSTVQTSVPEPCDRQGEGALAAADRERIEHIDITERGNHRAVEPSAQSIEVNVEEGAAAMGVVYGHDADEAVRGDELQQDSAGEEALREYVHNVSS